MKATWGTARIRAKFRIDSKYVSTFKRIQCFCFLSLDIYRLVNAYFRTNVLATLEMRGSPTIFSVTMK